MTKNTKLAAIQTALSTAQDAIRAAVNDLTPHLEDQHRKIPDSERRRQIDILCDSLNDYAADAIDDVKSEAQS